MLFTFASYTIHRQPPAEKSKSNGASYIVKFQLFPSASRGLDQLRDLAALIHDSVEIVAEMVGNSDEREDLVRGLSDAETKASDLHHAVLTFLRTNYLSPLPREDMYTFARLLHEAVELLRGAGELINALGSTPLSARAAEQLELMGQLGELANGSLRRLHHLDDLEDNWLQMLHLSKRMARTHLAWSIENANFSKATTMHRHQLVADQLNESCTVMRQFADHLGRVLVKES